MSSITLPIPVHEYLERFAARKRWQAAARAVGIAVTGTLAWMLLWCFIDRLLALPAMVRAVALAANVGFIAAVLARPVRQWITGTDPLRVASEVERREPAFAQRLETVTSRALGPVGWRGSEQLLEALAGEVSAAVSARDPAALLPWAPPLRAWVAATVLIAGMAGLWRVRWLDLPTLARRYALPVADVPPVTTTRLRVVPGDVSIAEGDTLRVKVSAAHLAESSPVLHARTASSSTSSSASERAAVWSEQVMAPAPEGNFEARIRNVDRDVEYFVSGGDARSERFSVTVLHKPAVARMRVRYAYPMYTGLPPREVDNNGGQIEAPVGTEVTLLIEATEPIALATMTIGGEVLRMSAVQPMTASATFMVRESKRFTIRMASARGPSGPTGAFRGGSIRAIPDRPPVVRWRENAAAREVEADSVVSVGYQTVDDYGLSRLDAEVFIARAAGGTERRSIALLIAPRRQERGERGTVALDLRTLGARPGDAIELRLRGEDRAGQLDLSDALRLHVIAPPATSPAAAPRPATPPASPAATQPTDFPAVPLDPPGFEDALRAYFDALRREH